MLLWLKNQWNENQNTDNCSKCIWRLCCTVYSICSSTNQGRESLVIKKWGVPCTHITHEWDCDIYTTRDATSGYSENCGAYTCNNIWPILSTWLYKNDIDIIKNSIEIGRILRKLQEFIVIDNYRTERIDFIEYTILNDMYSLEQLSQWIICSKKDMEKEFQHWQLAIIN